MEESCVGCHNAHADSPKTDWKVGDIRGIQSVCRYLQVPWVDMTSPHLNNLVLLMGAAFLAAAALTFVLSNQRKKAIKKVEDLAGAERLKNEALQMAIQRVEDGEAQVGAILDTMLDGVLTILPSGEILSANRAALEMFGANRPEQMIGKLISELLPVASELDLPFTCFEGNSEDKRAVGLRIETLAQRFSGVHYPVEFSLSEAVKDGKSTYTAIFRDLTEQKAAALKLKQAETRLVDAIESLPRWFCLVRRRRQACALQQQVQGILQQQRRPN